MVENESPVLCKLKHGTLSGVSDHDIEAPVKGLTKVAVTLLGHPPSTCHPGVVISSDTVGLTYLDNFEEGSMAARGKSFNVGAEDRGSASFDFKIKDHPDSSLAGTFSWEPYPSAPSGFWLVWPLLSGTLLCLIAWALYARLYAGRC